EAGDDDGDERAGVPHHETDDEADDGDGEQAVTDALSGVGEPADAAPLGNDGIDGAAVGIGGDGVAAVGVLVRCFAHGSQPAPASSASRSSRTRSWEKCSTATR